MSNTTDNTNVTDQAWLAFHGHAGFMRYEAAAIRRRFDRGDMGGDVSALVLAFESRQGAPIAINRAYDVAVKFHPDVPFSDGSVEWYVYNTWVTMVFGFWSQACNAAHFTNAQLWG